MDIILRAAITADCYIARHSNETVEWTLDLHLFKEQTMGWPVIMGSNTKETLNTDLSGRKEIVIHRDDIPKQILSNIKTKMLCYWRGQDKHIIFSIFNTHVLDFSPISFCKRGKTFFKP